jgi:Predicted enzyme with a TIM-barrel fold
MAEILKKHPNLDTLSMGMSSDLELAIENGATFVRIGTDIFGKRV